MPIEMSHGKARSVLPRASDLPRLDSPSGKTEAKPKAARGPDGRFAAGNGTARGARFVHTIRKCLGMKEAPWEALTVARDARRVFSHLMSSLPCDAAPVRALAVIHARHVALNAYYTTKAEQAGLDTDRGLKLLDVADRQSQRAERVLVTCLDVAQKMAKRLDDAGDAGILDDFERPGS